jgi:hypothetical protein
MLILSLVLFGLAAVLGITVAVALFAKRPTSKPVAVAHGLAGAAGLVVLLITASRQPNHLLSIALILLVIAALGGIILFANDLRARPGPNALVVIHALAAVTAVVLVALVAF